MFRKRVLATMLIVIWGASSQAATLTQFTAGQPARAADVNANFKALNDELTALKSFHNLTNEQVAALKAAIQAQGLRWTEQQVDCSNNPRALMDIYAQQGAGLVYMGLVIKGDCYANLTQQFHGLTLSLRATAEAPARLLPDGSAWSLSGGFNGGLYLNNLTLQPPAGATGVLFSRVAQGSVDNVIIEGGSVGVLAQAGAQAYLGNVQVKSTQHYGVMVTSGANLRISNNMPDAKLVDTNQGTGMRIDQAEVGLGTSIDIRAPQAVQVMVNGSLAMQNGQTAPNRLTATGHIQIFSDGQFQVQELMLSGNANLNQGTLTTSYLDMTGNLSLGSASSFYTEALKMNGSTIINNASFTSQNNDITGKVRVAEGGKLVLRKGILRAVQPNSMDYQQSIALEMSDGAVAKTGDYRDPGGPVATEFTIQGQLNLNTSTLTTEWTELNGGLASDASVVRLNYSELNAPGRDANDIQPVSMNRGSSLTLWSSDIFARKIALSSSSASADDADFSTTQFNVHNNSSVNINRCTGSGDWNLDSGQVNLLDCQLGQSAMFASLGSKVRMWGGQFGVVHLDLASVGSFTNMTLTGNSQMTGIENYFIGAGAVMMLDNVTLTRTKHFDNNHVLRLATNSVMANSTLSCSPKAYVEWWQSAASVGNTGTCNLP